MKQENLNELRNIYLDIATGGEGPEFLSEKKDITIPQALMSFVPNPVKTAIKNTERDWKSQYGSTIRPSKAEKAAEAKAAAAKAAAAKAAEAKAAEAKAAAAKAAEAKAAEAKAAAVTQRPAAGTPAAAPVTQRPAASGPVLSKLDGVEGTGVGANFNKKAFTDTERTRYSSVAAQNAARTSAASGTTPKPVAPVAPVGDKFGTNSSIKSPSSTEVKSNTPTQLTQMQPSSSDNTSSSSPEGMSKRLEDALKIKKSDVTSSYQFPMYKTLRDLSDSYNEIYEAKKQVDQDEDGDNDFADNMIARMVASGMSREEAIKKVKNKNYNKKDELDEGIRSAIRGLFGKKKEPEVKKPPSRGAELRAKYNIEPGNTAKQQILNLTYKRAKEDEKKYGDSTYSRSVSDNSAAAHKARLEAGYSLYHATGGSGGEGGSGGPGRGSKAAKRAAALNNSYDLYDLIQSHLLEYGFADTEEGANMIIENMSPSWIKQILSED